MHFHTIRTTTNPTPDSVIQATKVPGLLHVTAPRGNGLSVQLKKDVIMNLRVQKSHEEILIAE